MAEEIYLESDVNVNERNRSWVLDIDEELRNMASSPGITWQGRIRGTERNESSIYKVPASIREKQRDSYMPSMVSFGPYHHGHQSCTRTQDKKKLVLLHSLKRSEKTATQCVEALRRWVQILKNQYDELDAHWQQDNDAFLELMIYDGCFFLEILREASNFREANYSDNNHHWDNPVWDMRISPNELMERYRHDMLLLENQLPMFLLYELLAVQTGKDMDEAREDLNRELVIFIFPTAPKISIELSCIHVPDFCKKSLLVSGHEHIISGGNVSAVTAPGTVLSPIRRAFMRCSATTLGTVLSPIRRAYTRCSAATALSTVPSPIRRAYMRWCYPFKLLRNLFKTQSPTEFHVNIPSATDLEKVGIGFSRSRYRSLKDISVGRRTLTLPEIYVDGSTKLMYLNVIAYEQLDQSYQGDNIDALRQIYEQPDQSYQNDVIIDYIEQLWPSHRGVSHRGVTSYIHFMCRLLQGADDAKLLKLHRIIHTELSNDAVAEIFNSMAKGIFLDPETFLEYEYNQQGRKLRELFKKMSDEWHMDLWQKYLRSPWAIISLIGAFLLFCLTAIQTVYTVLGYYNHK